MKKNVNLGNNLKEEVKNNLVIDEEKIKEEFLASFVEVKAEDRRAILNWRKSYCEDELGEKKRAFLCALDNALEEIDYDFYMVMIFSYEEKKVLSSKGEEVIPDYIFAEANKNEETLWLARTIVKYGEALEEVCNYDRIRATKELCVFKK